MSLSAQVIFSDTFGSTGDPAAFLNGRTPDVTTDSANWSALNTGSTATSVATADGSAYLGSSQGNNAMAGVVFDAGYFNDIAGIYELTATVELDANPGEAGWVAIGFSQNVSSLANRGYYQNGVGNEGQPWMFLRRNGLLTVRSDSGNSLLLDYNAFDPTGNPTVTHDITLRLDTSVADWTVDAFFNSTPLDLNGLDDGNTYTYGSNPTSIASVGLTFSSGVAGTAGVQDITLTQIPEPSSVALLLVGGLSALLLRRRNRS
jgi:hypothetical protein